MKRFDLRELKEGVIDRIQAIIKDDLAESEAAIFIFELTDFALVQQSADAIKALNCDLLNSLKYNEVDWTISVRKQGA
jgi:NADH-quinone oxidoreductase subunit E